MSKHTTLHVGGRADWYVEAQSVQEIQQALSFAQEKNLPVAILGGGSNSLFLDEGFRGLVLRPLLTGIQIPVVQKNDTQAQSAQGSTVLVRAEAGALSIAVARKTADAGLRGFEWAATLPGTIGGAVRGNAGCFGGETKDNLVHVEILRDGKLLTIPASECEFAYRESAFKHKYAMDVILAATFAMVVDEVPACQARFQAVVEKRKATQPQGTSSAGCMFKNVEIRNQTDLAKLAAHTQIPQNFITQGVLPAGWLIEQADLKGFAIGGASVSTVHGNFLVVAPGTTADHVLQLVATIKTRIRNQFGVQLTEEVQSFI